MELKAGSCRSTVQCFGHQATPPSITGQVLEGIDNVTWYLPITMSPAPEPLPYINPEPVRFRFWPSLATTPFHESVPTRVELP